MLTSPATFESTVNRTDIGRFGNKIGMAPEGIDLGNACADDRCGVCRVEDHEVCSMISGCSCCESSMKHIDDEYRESYYANLR